MLVPGRLRMSDSDAVVQQFVEMTGASVDLANFYLESAKGDLMRALDTFYESGGDAGAAPAPSAPGARGAGAPAAEGEDDDADEDDDDDDDFPEPLVEEPSAGPGANAGPRRAGPMSLDEATRSMFEQAAQALACRAHASLTPAERYYSGRRAALTRRGDAGRGARRRRGGHRAAPRDVRREGVRRSLTKIPNPQARRDCLEI